MKKQLLAAAIVVGLGSATTTVGEVQTAPNAEIAYKIVKKLKGSEGAQAFGQAVGAAAGAALGSVLGPFGAAFGAGLGAY